MCPGVRRRCNSILTIFPLIATSALVKLLGAPAGVPTINLLLWSRLNLLFELSFASMCWVIAVLSVLFNDGRC